METLQTVIRANRYLWEAVGGVKHWVVHLDSVEIVKAHIKAISTLYMTSIYFCYYLADSCHSVV